MASIRKRTISWTTKTGSTRSATRWQVRYVDDAGEEYTRDFALKRAAQEWLDEQTAHLVRGTHIAPLKARTTVGEWCDIWIEGYGLRRSSTVRQAETHIKRIKRRFEHHQLGAVRPSMVRAWCAELKAEGLADSTIAALHGRLAQLYRDAIEDGLVSRSPCSRRTSPPAGKQKPYIITTEQLWAIYDAVPENVRPAVLTGAFMGTRLAEAGGLMIADLDLMRGVWSPARQYPGRPEDALKTTTARTPVSFAPTLALELAAHIASTQAFRKGEWLLCDLWGDRMSPWTIQRAMRAVRDQVEGLPASFSYHDLRHYFASMLIADGADVKKVQAALRHASAKTTLDTYSHLWPDADETIRAAGDKVLRARLAEHESDSNRTVDAEKGP